MVLKHSTDTLLIFGDTLKQHYVVFTSWDDSLKIQSLSLKTTFMVYWLVKGRTTPSAIYTVSPTGLTWDFISTLSWLLCLLLLLSSSDNFFCGFFGALCLYQHTEIVGRLDSYSPADCVGVWRVVEKWAMPDTQPKSYSPSPGLQGALCQWQVCQKNDFETITSR